MINETRTAPELQAVALELNLSLGQGSAAIAPIISKMVEPAPTIAYWTISMIGLMLSFCVSTSEEGHSEPKKISLDKSLASIVMGESKHDADDEPTWR